MNRKDKINKFKDILIFEALFRILSILLILPCIKFLLDLFCYLLGYSYISFDIVLNNLNDWRIWPLVLILLIIVAFFILLEIYISMIIFYKQHEDNISIKSLLYAGIKEIIKSIRIKRIFIFFIAIYLAMFSFMYNGFISRVKMPQFIKDVILSNDKFTFLYYFVLAIIGIFTILLIFVFNEYFINNEGVIKSLKNSIKNVYGRFIYIALTIIGIRVGIALIGYLLSSFVLEINNFLTSSNTLGITVTSLLFMIIKIFVKAFVFLKFVFIVASIRFFIYMIYYKNNKDKCDDWIHGLNLRYVPKRRLIKRIIIITCLLIIGNIIYTGILARNNINSINDTNITAHRGAGHYAIENSLEALSYARLLGADYAEIDVQLTSDKGLILLHDNTFKRVCGDDRTPYDMTFDEAKTLKFIDDNTMTIPSLDDAIKVAKDHLLKLNIEIKGKDSLVEETAEKVVETIHKHNFVGECIVTGLNIKGLKKVKEIDTNIKTGYITFAANDKILDLNFIDAVCVEQGIVDRKFINKAHEARKQVHVWTVNEVDDLTNLFEMGVDNIITDIPKEADLHREVYKKADPRIRALLEVLD